MITRIRPVRKAVIRRSEPAESVLSISIAERYPIAHGTNAGVRLHMRHVGQALLCIPDTTFMSTESVRHRARQIHRATRVPPPDEATDWISASVTKLESPWMVSLSTLAAMA